MDNDENNKWERGGGGRLCSFVSLRWSTGNVHFLSLLCEVINGEVVPSLPSAPSSISLTILNADSRLPVWFTQRAKLQQIERYVLTSVPITYVCIYVQMQGRCVIFHTETPHLIYWVTLDVFPAIHVGTIYFPNNSSANRFYPLF